MGNFVMYLIESLLGQKAMVKQGADSTTLERRQQFASDLQLMKHRAMELGLFATGQRLDYPIRMVGFELAGDVEACERYEADLQRSARG